MSKYAAVLLGVVVLSAALFSVATPASAVGGCGPNGHRVRGAVAFSGDKIRPGAFEGPAIRQPACPTARCAACKMKHFVPACSNNLLGGTEAGDRGSGCVQRYQVRLE